MVYSGEALITHDRITLGMKCYVPNKIYFNELNNIYWFKNTKGYLHILNPTKGNFHDDSSNNIIPAYILRDLLLTEENTLKDTGKSKTFPNKSNMTLYLKGGIL